MRGSIVFTLLLFITGITGLQGQTKPKKVAPKDSTPIELISAGELEMMMVQNVETRYLRSKDSILVVFKQGDLLFSCDEAIHFPDSNFVVAFGHIEIERGDSIRAKGDTLFYDGNTRFAELRNNVYFTDQEIVLRSPYVNYYLNQDLATYQYGAVITDEEATLKSRRGYYYTKQKLLTFKRHVVLDNPKANYHIETDTLTYHTVNKVATFHDKTNITSQDGTIEAYAGEYYTAQGRSSFRERVTVENDTYIITSDSLDYRELARSGEATGKVKMYAKQDSLTIYGDKSIFDEETEQLDVFGQVLVEKSFGEDTLYLASDTLLSVTDTAGAQTLLAYPHVKIYSSSLEGVCDSLAYHTTDSLIEFFKAPVLWADNSQLTADTLIAIIRNNTIDRLRMRQNAFIISADSIQQYDQIKGRNMLATFQDSYLHQVDVNGNGQSIYFALEKDTLLIGMNRVDCGNMIMRFEGKSELQTITFIKEPDAKFIPPHELNASIIKLPDFKWRAEERLGMAFVTEHPFWEAGKAETKEPTKIIDDYIARKGRLFPREAVDTIGLGEQYGKLIYSKQLFVFIKGNMITFFDNGANKGRVKNDFYVDIIPQDQNDLLPKDRESRYEKLIMRPSAAQLSKKPFVLQMELPSYPILTLRFGQFTYNADNQPVYIWTEAYNYSF